MNPQNASEPEVLYSVAGHVAQITINRPDVLNAMNENTLTMLEEFVDRASEDDDIRVVVFTGSGDKAFVAGADISELKDLNSESGRKFSERGQKLYRKIAGKSPVDIAAIKRAMDASQGDHSSGYETEAREFGKIMETEDKAEGIEAFLEKRSATWKGK